MTYTEFNANGKVFRCPESMHQHIQKVFNGEYFNATMTALKGNISIIDIGANVGAFSFWAAHVWPECTITCYEPLKSNFELLQQNLEPFKDRVTFINSAVGDSTKTKLFLGRNNCGEASFYQLGEQAVAYEEVTTIPSSYIPKADILKIDTEGSEIEILRGINEFDYPFILLEYHSERNRRKIEEWLYAYTLVGSHAERPDRGVVLYRLNV